MEFGGAWCTGPRGALQHSLAGEGGRKLMLGLKWVVCPHFAGSHHLTAPTSGSGPASADLCSSTHLLGTAASSPVELRKECLPCTVGVRTSEMACAKCPGLCRDWSKHSAPNPSQRAIFIVTVRLLSATQVPLFSCHFSQLSPRL